MSVDLRIRVEDREVDAALDRLRLALAGDMRKPMTEIGRRLKMSVQLRFRDQVSPGGTPWEPSRRVKRDGGQTLRDQSRLRNSITYVATHTGVAVGTNVVYAPPHQFGATIRPRRSRFLAIPVTPAARQAGSPRRFPGELRFVMLPGKGVLLDKDGVAQYVLVKSVRIPARPFLGASQQDREAILEIASRHLDRAWRGI